MRHAPAPIGLPALFLSAVAPASADKTEPSADFFVAPGGNDAQKHEIVRKLTDAMVSIEGENLRPVT